MRSPYDYLVLAAGAAHAYFGHPEWAARAPGLKTLDDALEMRRRVLLAFEAAEREADAGEQRRLLTFVIVGGGPTGVELAGALAEIARQSLRKDFRRIHPESARIVLLEGGPHVLAPFAEPLREAARRSLERLGVEVRTGADRHWRRRGRRDDRGAERDLRGARCCGRPAWRRRRSRDRSACRSIAPAASRRSRRSPSPAYPEHLRRRRHVRCSCRTASRCPAWRRSRCSRARAPARTFARAIAGQPLEPFRYKDYGIMATIGRGAAVGDVFGLKISGFFAWLFWIFLHIFWLIGFRNRFVVMTEWAWAYFSLQRRVRSDHRGLRASSES